MSTVYVAAPVTLLDLAKIARPARGTTFTIDVDDTDPVQEVARLTDHTLADVVIDAASNSTTPLGWALQTAKVGGDIILASGCDIRVEGGLVGALRRR